MEQIFLASRSKNQFLDKRELLLGVRDGLELEVITPSEYLLHLVCSNPHGNHHPFPASEVSYHVVTTRFSFGSGEWRDGADSWWHLGALRE